MTRQQWKDLLEGIGFLAIIASLIFVGIETRNSTRQAELNTIAMEISAYQELMTNIEEINVLALERDDTARAFMRLWPEDVDLDLEAYRERRLLFILFRHGDTAFFMYERGAISEERLRSALGPVPIHTVAGREFWKGFKQVFSEGYRDYIDTLIADNSRAY